MESPDKIDIYILLFAGTGIMCLLAAGIAFFIFFYRKKLDTQKKSMAELKQKMQTDMLQYNIEQLEQERNRFASELHDNVGGKLAALRLSMARMEQNPEKTTMINDLAATGKQTIDHLIEMTRRISHNLAPPDFEDGGLVNGINELCDWIAASSSMQVLFKNNGIPANLGRQQEIVIYRVIQELLSNTIRHAGASHIEIRLHRKEQQLQLHYTDNGVGISTPEVKTGGLGLKNIRNRVLSLKGSFSLLKEPGQGFSCDIVIPV